MNSYKSATSATMDPELFTVIHIAFITFQIVHREAILIHVMKKLDKICS